MLAPDRDGRFVSEAGGVAYLTVVVDSAAVENLIAFRCCLVELLNTVFLETGQAGFFALEATTHMPALMHFVTGPVH